MGMSVELTSATPQMAGIYSAQASNLTRFSTPSSRWSSDWSGRSHRPRTGAVETPNFHPVDSVSIEFTDAGTGLQSLELSDNKGTLELFEATVISTTPPRRLMCLQTMASQPWTFCSRKRTSLGINCSTMAMLPLPQMPMLRARFYP